MERIKAKRIGGRELFRFTLSGAVMLEFIWLLIETRGDFANGILFFIQAQSNLFVIGFFVILFGATYFLGRKAGNDIIILDQNYTLVGIKYALWVSAVILAYLLIVYAAHNVLREALRSIIQLVSAVVAPVTAVWLLSVRRIKVKATRNDLK